MRIKVDMTTKPTTEPPSGRCIYCGHVTHNVTVSHAGRLYACPWRDRQACYRRERDLPTR